MFKKTLSEDGLSAYIAKQLNFIFPDKDMIHEGKLKPFVTKALKRIEHCFSKINVKYYFDGKNILFNHLHADQYATFLYYLSNTVWRDSKDENIASKIYYLNKMLHALDAYYEVELPDVFLLSHPVGAVLGRGNYNDYLVVYQRVSVGANKNQVYPRIGKAVIMYGGSALIGKCTVGDNCLFSIGTIVMDRDIPSDMVVYGTYPNINHKRTTKSVMERYFL